jgi:hypothetical protein
MKHQPSAEQTPVQVLVHETTGQEIRPGAACTTFRGETVTVSALYPAPPESASSGKVLITSATDGFEREIYPSVIGCRFVVPAIAAKLAAAATKTFTLTQPQFKVLLSALQHAIDVYQDTRQLRTEADAEAVRAAIRAQANHQEVK